ncbi:MAG: hypothetical protein M3406_05420, partial [Chloroflexota bacterium]|nr:hypothetical protein [Chloroflexota bacterium]
MQSLRPHLAASGLVLASVLVATGAALLLDRLGAVLPGSVAAALVVTGLFARRAPEGLVTFAVFSLLADTVEHWLGLDFLLFDEITIALFLPIAVVCHGAPNGRLRIGLPEAALAVLAVAGISSSLIGEVSPVTWLAGLALLFKAIAMLYIVSWLRLTVDDAGRMGFTVIVIGLVIGALGFVEWLNPAAFQTALGLPPYDQARGAVTVVRSIFLSPAQYGWMTAFTSLLLYAMFIAKRVWWALPLAMGLNLGTVLSGRRTPLLGVLVAIAAGFARQFRAGGFAGSLVRTWVPLLSAVVLLGALLLPILGSLYRYTISEYLPSPIAVAELFSDAPNADVVADLHPRTALYFGSIAVARDRFPLGAGLGRYGSHLSRAEYSPVYAEYGLDRIYQLAPERPNAVTDTYWPMILGETGVVGLGAALAFFGSVVVSLWRGVSAATSATARTVGLAVLMVFAEGFVRSLTASVYT